MHLLRVLDNQLIEAEIDSFQSSEFSNFTKSARFDFDWGIELNHQVYKLFVKESNLILGLISLIDVSEELRIHVNLIEASKENVGQKKEYHKIAGCLLAFSAQQAFLRGYGGFVSLRPKTLLIDHYCNTYGFQQYGRYLGIEGNSAHFLIQQYLNND